MAAGGNDQALRLYVDEFMDGDHWRWRLADANGNFLTDYAVSLDPTDARHSALLDLPPYLKRHADPNKWPEDEARLLGEIGESIGEKVLGPIGPAIVRGRAAATVRVILPSKPKDASGLISYPLELGHVNGRPLALRGVSLVYEMDGEGEQIEHPPVGETLRMLAIFSLPTDQSALALRRERYQLQQLIKTLRQTRRLAIDLRII